MRGDGRKWNKSLTDVGDATRRACMNLQPLDPGPGQTPVAWGCAFYWHGPQDGRWRPSPPFPEVIHLFTLLIFVLMLRRG